MIKLDRALVVEGKYDKIKLSSFIDSLVIVTDGFRIFKDEKKKKLIKYLAISRGIIILTDSDRAGQLIRNHIKSFASGGQIQIAYIPKIIGKEPRKAVTSKEGTLGVEGVSKKIILDALERCGVFCKQKNLVHKDGALITNLDLLEVGLFGGKNSSSKRKKFLEMLGLPDFLSSKQLLNILNSSCSRADFAKKVKMLNEKD